MIISKVAACARAINRTNSIAALVALMMWYIIEGGTRNSAASMLSGSTILLACGCIVAFAVIREFKR